MKTYKMNMVAIALAALSIVACGKKGGGSTATTPKDKSNSTGALCRNGFCEPGTGSLGNLGRRVWGGELRVTDMARYRQFMEDSGGCRNSKDCRNLDSELGLLIGLRDGYVPGQARFKLRTKKKNGNSRACTLDADVYAQVNRNNRGLLLNYDVDNTVNTCSGRRGKNRRSGFALDFEFDGFQFGARSDRGHSRYRDDHRDYDRYDREHRTSGLLQIVTTFTSNSKSKRDKMTAQLYFDGRAFAKGTLNDEYYDRGQDSYDHRRRDRNRRDHRDDDDGFYFSFSL